jgi:predicted nucleic acid-binding protein
VGPQARLIFSMRAGRQGAVLDRRRSLPVTLVVDASVALKWVLQEPDSHLAQALAEGHEELLVPDFWLNEACNICWLQVRKSIWTPDEAREAFNLLQAQIPPTPTGDLTLHNVALEIGIAANHSTYDTLYLSFAIAMGARGVVVADGPFVRDLGRHPDPTLADMVIPLADWAATHGLL